MALVSTNTRWGEYQTDDGAREAFEKVASVLSAVTTALSAQHGATFIARVRQMSLSADQQVEVKLSVAAAGSFEPSYTLSAI